jgi:hypothetical protein
MSPVSRAVVVVSLALLLFTIPHTLEDFATGEPARAGVPAPVLSLVLSVIVGVQALGLHLIGSGRRLGFLLHAVIGVFWPVASGVAQLPAIFSGETYRSGFISQFYVFGIIAVGAGLLVVSLLAFRASSKSE